MTKARRKGVAVTTFVTASPESKTTAVADLSGIGSRIGEATAAAAGPTSSIPAAAADECRPNHSVVRRVRPKFQAISAQAAAWHQRFVELSAGGAASYASAEDVGASLLGAINAPFLATLGRPLIGNGVHCFTDAAGHGTPGGAGGILWGNGGRGGDSTAMGVAGATAARGALAGRAG